MVTSATPKRKTPPGQADRGQTNGERSGRFGVDRDLHRHRTPGAAASHPGSEKFLRTTQARAIVRLDWLLLPMVSELDAIFATNQFTRLGGDKVHSRVELLRCTVKCGGDVMTNLYVFVLGVMATLAPSLLLLAFLIGRELTGKSDEGAHSSSP